MEAAGAIGREHMGDDGPHGRVLTPITTRSWAITSANTSPPSGGRTWAPTYEGYKNIKPRRSCVVPNVSPTNCPGTQGNPREPKGTQGTQGIQGVDDPPRYAPRIASSREPRTDPDAPGIRGDRGAAPGKSKSPSRGDGPAEISRSKPSRSKSKPTGSG